MTRSLRIVQRNALVYSHTWRGSLFTSFLQPALFLLSIGIGVGNLVDRGGTALPGGVDFLTFLAPGLLAGACMQTASFESSWPILGRMTWGRNYEAIAATPLGAIDIVFGELTWLAVRLLMVATAFMLVMASFGVPRSPLALLAVPAGALTGLAFGAPIMAFAATRRDGQDFNVLFRFIITPLYLFSGIFFPVSRLPAVLQPLALLSPLFHGVALARSLTLGTAAPPGTAVHAGFLLALITTGAAAAVRAFGRRLRQ